MKRYRYQEPGPPGDEGNATIVTRTEEEILAEYFPYWSERMRALGHESQITEQACIEDWIIVNWAEEVKDEV